MQPPVEKVLSKLLRRQLQTTDEEDDGYRAVQNGELGLDRAAGGRNTYFLKVSECLSIFLRKELSLTGPYVGEYGGKCEPNDEELVDQELYYFTPKVLWPAGRTHLLRSGFPASVSRSHRKEILRYSDGDSHCIRRGQPSPVGESAEKYKKHQERSGGLEVRGHVFTAEMLSQSWKRRKDKKQAKGT